VNLASPPRSPLWHQRLPPSSGFGALLQQGPVPASFAPARTPPRQVLTHHAGRFLRQPRTPRLRSCRHPLAGVGEPQVEKVGLHSPVAPLGFITDGRRHTWQRVAGIAPGPVVENDLKFCSVIHSAQGFSGAGTSDPAGAAEHLFQCRAASASARDRALLSRGPSRPMASFGSRHFAVGCRDHRDDSLPPPGPRRTFVDEASTGARVSTRFIKPLHKFVWRCSPVTFLFRQASWHLAQPWTSASSSCSPA